MESRDRCCHQRSATRHHRCRQDDGEAGGKLCGPGVWAGRCRGDEPGSDSRLRPLCRGLASDAAQATARIRIFRGGGGYLQTGKASSVAVAG